ncbi:MAG: hypothetical protein ACFCVE_08065 [Phycisphaerae bacterium]
MRRTLRISLLSLVAVLMPVFASALLATGPGASPSLISGVVREQQRLQQPATQPSGATTVTAEAATANIEAPEFSVVRGVEGFWQIVRDQKGVWWFRSPEGKLEFLNTVTTVVPYQLGRREAGPHYVSRDYNGGITNDGDIEAWATATLERVLDSGFKALGAWCHPAFHELDVPMTRDLNLWAWGQAAGPRMYTPGFRLAIRQAVQQQVEPLRDNRNLVGYYTDNELNWGDSGVGPWLYFDHLPPADPNRREVIGVIRQLWQTPEAFNADWGLAIERWEDLDAISTLPRPGTAYSRLFHAWLEKLAYDYFELTTALVREYDPNHLVLGVRFRGYAPPEVVRASRDFTDAQSINYYVADARLDRGMFEMMYRESRQPVILTEYAFHALDGRSGNRNTFGFAGQVLDQQARADGYRIFTTRLARVPYVIGADWFQWSDEPPSGRTLDGEDVNFGVVDVDDRAYELLVEAVRQTTPLLNDLHAASAEDDKRDVWRERFAELPTFGVPKRQDPIDINGELSDWPELSRLQGVRHAQTVGLERSTIPRPNVFAAWDETGVWMAFEIFDRDIHGAADGRWWTRDNFEFWIATRPADPEQDGYRKHDHQFFFAPIAFPGEDGAAGVTGQWKRPGDALQTTLSPHPDVQDSVRIFPDRYVVELFLPASALHGYTPEADAELAFNFHAFDFQQAISYFWSAPKEVQTQYKPSTWGRLVLLPAESDSPETTVKAEPGEPADRAEPAVATTDVEPVQGQ